jgi:hypothetical protein
VQAVRAVGWWLGRVGWRLGRVGWWLDRVGWRLDPVGWGRDRLGVAAGSSRTGADWPDQGGAHQAPGTDALFRAPSLQAVLQSGTMFYCIVAPDEQAHGKRSLPA